MGEEKREVGQLDLWLYSGDEKEQVDYEWVLWTEMAQLVDGYSGQKRECEKSRFGVWENEWIFTLFFDMGKEK